MSEALDPATAVRFREAGEHYRAGDLATAERLLEEVVRAARSGSTSWSRLRRMRTSG